MDAISQSVSRIKAHFRPRDFFLDFFACLIPGFIFFVSASALVLGLFFIAASYFIQLQWLSSLSPHINIWLTFTGKFWIYTCAIFVSYVIGHLLYRQDPKNPDYASFIRIRSKALKNNDWTVNEYALLPEDVQYPYSNLKRYLDLRGFKHLLRYVNWKEHANPSPTSPTEYQRSKTFINKLKMRIAFFFPEHDINIIRNEAHIRMASSMWHASKYIIATSYWCIGIVIFASILISSYAIYYAFNNNSSSMPLSVIVLLLSTASAILLYLGWRSQKTARDKMKEFSDYKTALLQDDHERNDQSGSTREIKSNLAVLPEKVRVSFQWYDRGPLFSIICLCVQLVFLIKINGAVQVQIGLELLFAYCIICFVILLGSLFVKHRVEETYHYQRVREIIYVLETAFLAGVLDDNLISAYRESFLGVVPTKQCGSIISTSYMS